MSDAEVKAKLIIEHAQAIAALGQVEEGFDKVNDHVDKTGGGIGDMFKQAMATAVGFQLSSVIDQFKSLGSEIFHLGEGFIESASGLEEQQKAVRGVLMITDQAGESMGALTEDSRQITDELGKMAIASGATKAAVVEDFTEMATRTGLSTDAVMDLTQSMADAGRAMPGGASALSEGFSNLASGIIRARNPVVQLIAATHELKGNAKQVADQLKNMSPDQAMQLGIAAIEKMGDKMRDVPLSFADIVTSLGDVKDEMTESVGAPMLQALMGPLNTFRSYLVDNQEVVRQWATTIGTDAGEWITEAATDFREGFVYLQDHAEEIKSDAKDIKDALIEGFQFGKEVFETGTEWFKKLSALNTSRAGIASDLQGHQMDLGSRYNQISSAVGSSSTDGQAEALENATAKGETYNEYLDAQEVQIAKTGEASRNLSNDLAMLGAKAGESSEEIQLAMAKIQSLQGDFNSKKENEDTDDARRTQAQTMALPNFYSSVATAAKPKEHVQVPPNYNFTGNITIQQDFKDQDPDRVVVEMKKGLRREATSKLAVASQIRGTVF